MPSGQSHSYLSPSRLLSNMGISNIRDYLPSSPSSLPPSSVTVSSRDVEGIFGEWQDTDLKDGLGRRYAQLVSIEVMFKADLQSAPTPDIPFEWSADLRLTIIQHTFRPKCPGDSARTGRDHLYTQAEVLTKGRSFQSRSRRSESKGQRRA